jgi:hypothetical protein
MNYLQKRFSKIEKKTRRNYEIDDNLYIELENISKYYQASVADLINASIEYLIETENINLYKKSNNQISVTHTILILESNIKGLEYLKEKYGVSIYKLVNIAIKNALKDV